MLVRIVEQTLDGLFHQEVEVPEGATVDMAMTIASRQIPEGYGIGIFGMRCSLQTTLQDGDRIELCRPLFIDPKEARRLRAKKAGQRQNTVRCHAR